MIENKEQENGITFKRREDLIQFIELIKDVKDIKTILTENKLPEMKTTLAFLIKFFWVLAFAVTGGIMTSIFAIMWKK